MAYQSVNSHKLASIDELHRFFRAYRTHDGFAYWFRGQENVSWSLLPKAGRPEYFLPDNRDLGRFHAWKESAIAHQNLPKSNIECLAIAQHHGLATRLLDWSKNPLVGTFFAVNALPNVDGAIFIYEPPEQYCKPEIEFELLRKSEGVFGYMPPAIAPRVIFQRAMFSVHCPANMPITINTSRFESTEKNLLRLIVPAEMKPEVLEMLSDYGVTVHSLFPDLDGLSTYLNRDTAKMVQWAHNK